MPLLYDEKAMQNFTFLCFDDLRVGNSKYQQIMRASQGLATDRTLKMCVKLTHERIDESVLAG